MTAEPFFKDPAETLAPMTAVQRIHYSVMKTLKRNFSVASFRLKDCSNAVAFLERINRDREKEQRITFVSMVIRAVGMTLVKYPRLGWMKRGWKFVKPSTADVGCSVGTEEPVSPVEVIRDAGSKGLEEISAELRELAIRARKQEKENLERIERLGRLVPFKWLLHLILRILMTRQRFIRHSVGSFQVSVLNQTQMDMSVTSHMATNLLLVGRIKDRPVVQDGQVLAKPTAFFCIHMDHTLHGAKDALLFTNEFYRLMENPDELL